MKAKVIGKVSLQRVNELSLETIRRIKRYQRKKVYKRPAFHMPFADLETLIRVRTMEALVNGGSHGKGK